MKKINFNRALVAKKKIFLFLLPALMLFAAGCKDKNLPEELPQTLSVNPELITCPDAGGDYTLVLTSPNGAWSATTNESWIRVTPTSGEKGTTEIRIKISPNKESAETKGEVTFTSGNETLQLPITRAAKAAPYLRIVSDIELNTPKEGGSYTIQIESNIKWSASSNAGWAKVNKGVSVNNDNITVTVNPATTPEETTATITIAPYGEGEAAGTQQVTITRGSTDATSLSVDPTEITAPENGGSFTVNVSSNAKWRVWKTWDMDWLTLSGSQDGDGNGSFSFSIEEATSMDAVSGILTIEEDRSDNYKHVVTQVAVSRKGKAAADLTVAPIAINASAEGGNYPVAIKSNYPWTATTSGNFFSLSSTSGDGYSTIVVSVNPATDERENTGYIIIRTSFGNEQARINIKRAGKEPEPEYMLMLSTDLLTAPYSGGEYTVNVTCNTSWRVSTSDVKVAILKLPTSGSGNGNFSFRVPSHTWNGEGQATITVISDESGIERTLQVIREEMPHGQYNYMDFSISPYRKVWIAKGNLQYKAHGNNWYNAYRSYLYVGGTTADHNTFGNEFFYGEQCTNNVISSVNDGLIDLFGWLTDKNPTLSSTNDADYNLYSAWHNDNRRDPAPNTHLVMEVLGFMGYAKSGYWRTWSKDEFEYLYSGRANASQLRSLATVCGVKGLLLMPDDWTKPSGVSFTPDVTASYSVNTYTEAQWGAVESSGAVFLPAAGYRDGITYHDGVGRYWTCDESKPWAIEFSADGQGAVIRQEQPHYGFSVRLIRLSE